jgi:hypothetical protein
LQNYKYEKNKIISFSTIDGETNACSQIYTQKSVSIFGKMDLHEKHPTIK